MIPDNPKDASQNITDDFLIFVNGTGKKFLDKPEKNLIFFFSVVITKHCVL